MPAPPHGFTRVSHFIEQSVQHEERHRWKAHDDMRLPCMQTWRLPPGQGGGVGGGGGGGGAQGQLSLVSRMNSVVVSPISASKVSVNDGHHPAVLFSLKAFHADPGNALIRRLISTAASRNHAFGTTYSI